MFNPTIDQNTVIEVQQWTTVKQSRVSAKTKKDITVQRTNKQASRKKLINVKNELNKALQPFMKHVLNDSHQQNELKNLKKSLTEKDVLIFIDFSENYACKYAIEPQSVHFGASRENISLHTGVWYTQKLYNLFVLHLRI